MAMGLRSTRRSTPLNDRAFHMSDDRAFHIRRPTMYRQPLFGPDASQRHRAQRVLMRGVGAGRSAQRGTSGATTGPRGARSAPPNPEEALTRSAAPHEPEPVRLSG